MDHRRRDGCESISVAIPTAPVATSNAASRPSSNTVVMTTTKNGGVSVQSLATAGRTASAAATIAASIKPASSIPRSAWGHPP
jgi:hypothetical protein